MDTGATLASFMAAGRRVSGAVRAVGDFGVGLMRGTLVERRLVARRTMTFSDDLRLLNDTLANTALADRYSVWGGLLIGWAREGAPLAHDSADADFAVLPEDLGAFEEAAQALRGAGFQPLYRFINNEGRVTEYSFARRGAKFEFFLLDRVGGQLRYFLYSLASQGPHPMQAVAYLPDQPLSMFRFLDRTWHKHTDHDAELTRIYGDWRNPVPGWWYMDDLAIVERVRWEWAAATQWAGGFGDVRHGQKL